MAQSNIQVMLGFEDEMVTDKNKHLVNFKTNKIGGKPDIPNNIKWEIPKCSFCQLPKPLVVQIYAPLENSRFHRTLYVFACINPNCWNRSESWTCFRVQTQETSPEESTQFVPKINSLNWCNDADDWGDDNNANANEENGNIINAERISDEDDESYSFDDSVRSVFENLTVDDRNANVGAQGGAVGRQNSPGASAEIEGDEGEIITIDSPVMPQKDIRALLHETSPLPSEICSGSSNIRRCPSLYFSSFFMSVWEESNNSLKSNDVHVKELWQEYQQKEDINAMNIEPNDGGGGGHENYEKSVPAHGDKIVHYFLSRLQKNPGQILRYSREAEKPLLLHPQQETVLKCQYCQEDRIFEFQVLSTIIPKLRLTADHKPCSRLDFGTALIYTCRNSCWASDNEARLETVIVQKEMY
ncbi:programmed cell death protein 2-like [Coccinella septempunctata]|uniref:programmed cell death protein 2-like n=1 Tax=Coccinella septempunctata TaxID=41139 RepID=UPI001D07DF6B|nr:programmed cell death protein 2-like [Coccinella septempunctata]